MFIDARPITTYGETVGWQVPIEPQPTRPSQRLSVLKDAVSANSLIVMDNLKRPPMTTANLSKSSLSGMEQAVPRFQDFIKRTPPLDQGKPLPPTPLKHRRCSSFGDSSAFSSRDVSPAERNSRRSSSVYSRTVSQWLPESPVWSGSDFADVPVPSIPLELLRSIAYSASTPRLGETIDAPHLLESRAYQPLLATPSPTISRTSTPSPSPSPPPPQPRPSILLPPPVQSPKIAKKHLRTVCLEKAKAALQAPGVEHMLPEELRAKAQGKPLLRLSRSLDTTVRDTMDMFRTPPPTMTPPELPTLTLVDAQGRDRVIGSPRASEARLPGFGFSDGYLGTRASVQVKSEAPLAKQSRQMSRDKATQALRLDCADEQRGRTRHRGPRTSDYRHYMLKTRQRPESTSSAESNAACQLAKDYHGLLAEQYRPASASPATSNGESDSSVRAHMKMVPQPLFHGKLQARQTRDRLGRRDSAGASVSPFQGRKQSTVSSFSGRKQGDADASMRSQGWIRDRLPSLPRLSVSNNHRRRSTSGTIPISPPVGLQHPPPTTFPSVPAARELPKHRRNSDDNRVSAYFPVNTEGNSLLFRRSKDKKFHPKLKSQASPVSPGVPMLAADIIAQRPQTAESLPSAVSLVRTPLSQTAPSSDAGSEKTAKQALLSRFTKGAVKYADILTRPSNYEPRPKPAAIPSTTGNHHEPTTHQPLTKLNIAAANATRRIANPDSPHLHSASASSTRSPPGTYLGWSNAAKTAFDAARSPTTKTHFHLTQPPARPLDEHPTALRCPPSSPSIGERRGSLFTGFMDFRREAKAEKRREEIKKSIKVVVTAQPAAARMGIHRASTEGDLAQPRVRSWEIPASWIGVGGLGGDVEEERRRPSLLKRMSDYAGVGMI